MSSNPPLLESPRRLVALERPGTPPGRRSTPASGHAAGWHPRRRCAPRAAAFTLVEMMVVLVLLGLLAGLVTINVRHYLVKGKANAARAEIAAIEHALATFYAEYGRYPTNDEGLEILTKPGEKIKDALLTKPPVDPWGKPYQYLCPGRNGEPYEVFTFGADGREGGAAGSADEDISSTTIAPKTDKAVP